VAISPCPNPDALRRDLAFAAFSEAVAARVAARIEYAKAELAEDAAEAKLAAALQQMEASDTPVASSS